MLYTPSFIAVIIFFAFVGLTLGLSFYLARGAKSSQGYFAAHGQIPWFVNGIAFAGDYLSAASFLGICGMIAFYGYDGFLYSIGYLAGWIVALFVIAEPIKRLGKFTFADALDAKFNSRGIKFVAGISTLVVSIFYLIPQMVGAGVLIQPLLGFPHWAGVLIVGTTVIIIVVTAGMVSTTWVQFLKGTLLVIFSTILTVLILQRGFEVKKFNTTAFQPQWPQNPIASTVWEGKPYETKLNEDGSFSLFRQYNNQLTRTQVLTQTSNGEILINGHPRGSLDGAAVLFAVGEVRDLPGERMKTGPLGPLEYLSTLQNSEVILWGTDTIKESDGTIHTIYFAKPTPGSQVLRPGETPTFKGIRSNDPFAKLDFISLMLALFCGTASLPHILIRYYTVKDAAAARKSTIVGIASIGFFYVLTLYIGLGAMTSGALDVTNSNMAAPLLARSFSELLFAMISAIAFTTVLGTVSGLILASAGAVAHDLVQSVGGIHLSDHEQVRVAKIASVVVGIIAILLGIIFEKMNVSYLVGWAFSLAASANLPSLVMLLFWKRTTKQGIIAAVTVGMISSLAWILLSADTYSKVYGLPADQALTPFSQPGIITIPLGFLTLIAVSLMTPRAKEFNIDQPDISKAAS
ncbi:sodium/solute symporter [Lacunimicrobium album]